VDTWVKTEPLVRVLFMLFSIFCLCGPGPQAPCLRRIWEVLAAFPVADDPYIARVKTESNEQNRFCSLITQNFCFAT
jgi:hypothetical protein